MARLRYYHNPGAFGVLSPECCYYLGILASDGTISIRQRNEQPAIKLEFHQQDLDILQAFKSFLGANNPIRLKTRTVDNQLTKGELLTSLFTVFQKL